MADCIRNQLTSDGLLRTWKFTSVPSGIPRAVKYSERIIKITPEQRNKLQKVEKRIRDTDDYIRRGANSREKWRTRNDL